MSVIRLNCGNLWTHDYLNKVIELNKEHKADGIQVESLFGSIAKLTPTARSADRLPYLERSQINHYVNKARENGIKIRYTLNTSCLGSIQTFKELWDTKLRADIIDLHSMGVCEWTITSPLIMELMRGMFPDDFLEVSTIAEVSTAEEAKRWMDLGANGVNISTSINRDLDAIKGIIAVGLTTTILANEACLYKCPWRKECYSLSSHDSTRSEDLFNYYPFNRCQQLRIENPEEWIRARMVLPSWLTSYQWMANVDWFKIAFRTHPISTALPILKHYLSGDDPANLLALWPSVARLGGTREPIDKTFISTRRLREIGFHDHFFTNGHKCKEYVCGVTCGYCGRALEHTMGKLTA